jgi:farnesyl diphosphate synthase
MNDATNAGAVFRQRLDGVAADIESLLDRLLGATPLADERARPQRLMDAMRYASLGGGKRLRPFLVVEAAALFKAPRERALMAGAALECVHCYSLAHDDLPAMDNDDLRRGRPTAHKKFDEATAILAGDGLLTLAFDILARPETHPNPAVRIDLVLALARASGLGGMVGGQMLDLAAEGRFEGGKAQPLGASDVKLLQTMKTGALLRFGCLAGAILGEASPEKRDALDRYGTLLGEAFQIADDLLDVEGDAATVGKATGKDAAAGKGTFVTVLGMDGAKARLKTLVTESEAALSVFGRDADVLKMAARFVAERKA